MTNSRPLRSNVVAAHESLASFLSKLVSTLSLNEVFLNKLLIGILIIAISNLLMVWRLNLGSNYLRSLQHIVSTSYVTLTALNNTIRLPSQSDSLYTTRVYCLSIFTLIQLYTLFKSLTDHQFTHSSRKVVRIFLLHTGFVIQSFFLPGCWELFMTLVESEENREVGVIFVLFTIIIFVAWVFMGYIIADNVIRQEKIQLSEEEKSIKERQLANANIVVLSIDTILLICMQYA